MKKIALCLYGKFNNRFSQNSGADGAKYIFENIIKSRDVDIFIHCWDPVFDSQIEQLYGDYIKQKIIEDPILFDDVIRENNINEEIFGAPGGQSFRTLQNSLSFFYSRGKSLKMKLRYEQENSFKYDVVVCSRFDLGQMDKYVGYQDYRVSKIDFDPHLDMSFIYTALWNQLNDGYPDMWFYSSSENMDVLASMYERSLDYYQEDSDYIKALVNGWPDSNANNFFSNEFFSASNLSPLRKYQVHEAHNNHILHKWFFIDSGLYRKTKFLPSTEGEFCVLKIGTGEGEDNVHPLYAPVYTCNSGLTKEKIKDIIAKIQDEGHKSCQFVFSHKLQSDYGYIKLRTAVDFTLSNSRRRILKRGVDAVVLGKVNSIFFLPLPSLPFIEYLYLGGTKKVLLNNTIWKVSSLDKVLKDESSTLVENDGQYYMLTTDKLEVCSLVKKQSLINKGISIAFSFIVNNLKALGVK